MARKIKPTQSVGRPLKLLVPIREWAVDVGNWVIQWMDDKDRNATGKTSGSVAVDVNKPNEVIITANKNIKYSLAGRSAGRKPPIDPLLEWAETSKGKRIASAAGMTLNQLAWAVRTNIGKRGTSPGTPKLRAQNITTVIRAKSKKHLVDLSLLAAQDASAAMVKLLTKLPDTKEI